MNGNTVRYDINCVDKCRWKIFLKPPSGDPAELEGWYDRAVV